MVIVFLGQDIAEFIQAREVLYNVVLIRKDWVFLPLCLDVEQSATSCVPSLGDKAGIEAIRPIKARDDLLEDLGYIQELVVCVFSTEDVVPRRGGR